MEHVRFHFLKSRFNTRSHFQGTYIAVETVPDSKTPTGDNDDDDEECMDWWTKYHASLDNMIEVSLPIISFSVKVVRFLFIFRYWNFSS